jgi:hypothetical protein
MGVDAQDRTDRAGGQSLDAPTQEAEHSMEIVARGRRDQHLMLQVAQFLVRSLCSGSDRLRQILVPAFAAI